MLFPRLPCKKIALIIVVVLILWFNLPIGIDITEILERSSTWLANLCVNR